MVYLMENLIEMVTRGSSISGNLHIPITKPPLHVAGCAIAATALAMFLAISRALKQSPPVATGPGFYR